jgi:hypothetical protein
MRGGFRRSRSFTKEAVAGSYGVHSGPHEAIRHQGREKRFGDAC